MRSKPQNRFISSRRRGMASQPIPPSCCTSFFSWHNLSPKRSFMRICQVSSLSFLLLLVWSLPALSQEPTPPSPQAPITEPGPAGQAAANLSSPPPASFNDGLELIVHREHLFVAPMRHIRPM